MYPAQNRKESGMQMNWQTMVAGGAVGGIFIGFLTSCWTRIKSAFWQVLSLAIAEVQIKDPQTNNAVLAYLIGNYKRFGLEDRTYGGTHEYTRDGKYGMIPFEDFANKTLIFRNGWRLLFYGRKRSTTSTTPADKFSSTQNNAASMMYLRGTFNPDAIVAEACNMRNQISWNVGKGSKHKRFFIRYIPNHNTTESKNQFSVGTGLAWYHEGVCRLLRHTPDELGRTFAGKRKALDTLIFPDNVKSVIREIQVWRNHRDWYHERSIPWKRGLILHGLPGTGKCLGKNTPILMYDGTIKMVQDVVEGDLLMGPDSTPRTVLSLARGREKMYRVVPKKGDSYIVNESHILSLKMSGRAAGYKKGDIVNMSVRDYLKSAANFRHYAKGWRTGIDFPLRMVPLHPYLLGLWLGDGHLHKPNLTMEDIEPLYEAHAILSKMGLSLNFVESAGNAATYSMGKPGTGQTLEGENPVRTALKELGLFRNSKFIPLLYKANSRSVRLEVLAGLLDTDSGFDDCNGYDITLEEESLARDVAYLARSLGLAAYVKPCKKTCSNGKVGDYFRIYISGDVDMIPVRITRKRARPRLQKKNVLVTGIQLEELSEDEYFGFEIDGNRLFMLGDFTVTHNTALVRAIAEDEDMPLFCFSLGELMNGELQRSWEEMQAYVPCIALCEDIDNVFHGRTNIVGMGGIGAMLAVQNADDTSDESAAATAALKGGRLTFDCLLNCIDGPRKQEGIFTVLTTNDITKIDSALGLPRTLPDGSVEFISTRPGRIDKAVELKTMQRDDKVKMAHRILGDSEEGMALIKKFLNKFPDLEETPAQFQERCAQIALSMFWREQAALEGEEGVADLVTKDIHERLLTGDSVDGLDMLAKTGELAGTSA